MLRRLVWSSWETLATRAARAYVAGPELSDALSVSHGLAHQGFFVTICPWDGPGDSPRHVADSYLRALGELGGSGLNSYLSIKAPPLGFSGTLLMELAEASRGVPTGLHFDSLAPEDADRTWTLMTHAAACGITVGCTLPARWKRSLSDVDRALKLGLRVRVVKGQWPDPEADVDMRSGFLALVERLAGRARSVAVATHDPHLAREALMRLRRKGTRCELELLFGLPVRQQLQAARDLRVPVRFYVPYGHAWLPYGLSQVQQNPRILWWTMRDWVLGWRQARSATLTAPVTRARSSTG